jgi:transposase-like protein
MTNNGDYQDVRRTGARTDRTDKWHLDEVVITIAGKKHWLWRAVDQERFVLDVLVQSRRDKKAAQSLLPSPTQCSRGLPRDYVATLQQSRRRSNCPGPRAP